MLTVMLSPLAGATPTVNPPPPPQKKKLPKAPDGANVFRRDDGTCWYVQNVQCPPNVNCNPPPPMQVECPPPDPKK